MVWCFYLAGIPLILFRLNGWFLIFISGTRLLFQKLFGRQTLRHLGHNQVYLIMSWCLQSQAGQSSIPGHVRGSLWFFLMEKLVEKWLICHLSLVDGTQFPLGNDIWMLLPCRWGTWRSLEMEVCSTVWWMQLSLMLMVGALAGLGCLHVVL